LAGKRVITSVVLDQTDTVAAGSPDGSVNDA
jgi:hypothetical protein